jgi:uncharacterized membrane protein
MKHRLVQSAITAFLTLATVHTAFANPSDTPPQTSEKCYGVVKAGMNDCATATASCASSATKDGQADAFILLPKGICERLVGGQLTVIKK